MAPRFRIEALSSHHARAGFDSGSEPLDRYFREHASQDVKRRMAACYVALALPGEDLAGFYTLAASSVALSDLAPETIRKLPRYPVVPVALLGRLAIDRRHQGQGLGGALLGDAIVRVARAELGIFAMLVDAKDTAAQRFYEHHGFTLLAGPGRRLYLPISPALRNASSPAD